MRVRSRLPLLPLLVGVFCFALGASCGGCDDTAGVSKGAPAGSACVEDDECAGTCEDETCVGDGPNNVASNSGNSGTDNSSTNNGTSNNAATNNGTSPNTSTGSGTSFCNGEPCACDDGVDNDMDGVTDGRDPECTGPYDDDEGSFATGIPGDNVDFCQDCFFDGDSGHGGGDGCQYHTDCLYGEEPTGGGNSGCFNCEVSQQCRDTCRPRTPNGCDCFGCCEVHTDDGDSVFVFIGSECDFDDIDDEQACPRCEQSTECVNECGRCELCPGKTVDDLPADCSGSGSGSGGDGDSCTSGGDCAGGVCEDDACVGEGDGSGGDNCTQNGDCAGGVCENDTCIGDGQGTGGDDCTQDGDCSGATTCDDGSCGGGSGGDDPAYTCDDGEVVCQVSGDCPDNHYCAQGCCIKVVL